MFNGGSFYLRKFLALLSDTARLLFCSNSNMWDLWRKIQAVKRYENVWITITQTLVFVWKASGTWNAIRERTKQFTVCGNCENQYFACILNYTKHLIWVISLYKRNSVYAWSNYKHFFYCFSNYQSCKERHLLILVVYFLYVL